VQGAPVLLHKAGGDATLLLRIEAGHRPVAHLPITTRAGRLLVVCFANQGSFEKRVGYPACWLSFPKSSLPARRNTTTRIVEKIA
jgi:hypothetical protein